MAGGKRPAPAIPQTTRAESGAQTDFGPVETPARKPGGEGRGPGYVAQLFRDAKKVLTQREDLATPPKVRRRKEDTGRTTFIAAARKIARRLTRLPPRVFRKAAGKTTGRPAHAAETGSAAGFLSEIVDWLNLWHDNEAGDPVNFDSDFADSDGLPSCDVDLGGGDSRTEFGYAEPNHLFPNLHLR